MNVIGCSSLGKGWFRVFLRLKKHSTHRRTLRRWGESVNERVILTEFLLLFDVEIIYGFFRSHGAEARIMLHPHLIVQVEITPWSWTCRSRRTIVGSDLLSSSVTCANEVFGFWRESTPSDWRIKIVSICELMSIGDDSGFERSTHRSRLKEEHGCISSVSRWLEDCRTRGGRKVKISRCLRLATTKEHLPDSK